MEGGRLLEFHTGERQCALARLGVDPHDLRERRSLSLLGRGPGRSRGRSRDRLSVLRLIVELAGFDRIGWLQLGGRDRLWLDDLGIALARPEPPKESSAGLFGPRLVGDLILQLLGLFGSLWRHDRLGVDGDLWFHGLGHHRGGWCSLGLQDLRSHRRLDGLCRALACPVKEPATGWGFCVPGSRGFDSGIDRRGFRGRRGRGD
jgi:hypothetical protein